MTPGIERFLLLGCLAILVLEAPSLLADLSLGDGSRAVLAAERTVVVAAPVVAEAQPTPVPVDAPALLLGVADEVPPGDAVLAALLAPEPGQ